MQGCLALIGIFLVLYFFQAILFGIGGVFDTYWKWASGFLLTPFPNLNGVITSSLIFAGVCLAYFSPGIIIKLIARNRTRDGIPELAHLFWGGLVYLLFYGALAAFGIWVLYLVVTGVWGWLFTS